MEALLKYDLITNPFPLQATKVGANTVATLTILATNNTDKDISLQGIAIQIPVGALASQLTTDEKGIVSLAPSGWQVTKTLYSPGFVKFSFQPKEAAKLCAGKAVTFNFNNIRVNEEPGVVEIQVTEGSSQCQFPNCPVKKLELSKFPDGWGKVKFAVNPPDIEYGKDTVLSWEGPAGASYRISYYSHDAKKIITIPADEGKAPLKSTGIYPGPNDPKLVLHRSTVFTLNVWQEVNRITYNAQDQKTVTVGDSPKPVIKSFKADKKVADFSKGAKKVTFTWEVENASIIEFDGAKMKDGTTKAEVDQRSTKRYGLRATSASGAFETLFEEVFSVEDYLSDHKFQMHRDKMIRLDDIDGTAIITTRMDQSITFDKNGTGMFNYVCVQTMTKRGKNYPMPTVNLTNPITWTPGDHNTVTVNVKNAGTLTTVWNAGGGMRYESRLKQDHFSNESKAEFVVVTNPRALKSTGSTEE